MTQGAPPQGTEGRSAASTAWLVIGGILAAALVAFIVQNTETISFDWLFWSFKMPLWLALVITALLSFLIGQLALMWRRHRRRKARRDAR